MKFNKLDVPYQWKDEFTKYPHGYTIFEALCSWTKQVDKMVDNINDWNDYLDNFVETFEFELQEEVRSTIAKWQSEGLLDDIIESALNTELDVVKDRISIIRKNIKLYGVKGDGITDDTKRIQSALSGGGYFYFPDGDYVITDTIHINNSVDIEFSDNAVIHYNKDSQSAFYFSGDFLPPVALVANADKGSMTIRVDNVDGISPGDWLYITSDEIVSRRARYYDTKREYVQVESVAGNTINLRKPLIFSHTVANSATFEKCNFLTDVKISGGTLICKSGPRPNMPNADRTHGFNFVKCKDFHITGTTVKGFDYACICTYNCVGGLIENNHVEINYSDGLQYGIVTHSDYLTNVTNNTADCARSAIDLSRVSIECVVSNNLIYRGRIGCHTVVNCSFLGNKLSNGFIINRGIDNTISNNTVICYYHDSLRTEEAGLDGSAHVSNNYFIGMFSDDIPKYGTVFTGNTIRAYDHKGYFLRVRYTHGSEGLKIIDNDFEYIGSNQPSVGIDFYSLAEVVRDVIIKGNRITNTNVGIDFSAKTSNVLSTNVIVSDNIIRATEKGIVFRLINNVTIIGNIIEGITMLDKGIEKRYTDWLDRNGLVIAMNIIKNANIGIDSTEGPGKYKDSVVANNSYVNVATPEQIDQFEP